YYNTCACTNYVNYGGIKMKELSDETLEQIDGGKSNREFGYEVGHAYDDAKEFAKGFSEGITSVEFH
ncbi:bacteriocin, partial [Clostridium butyricum]|uniref:bacteriocin n=1 Tax=Clostridium butyricum TaxID=1492 RepID=UPI0028FDB8CB